MKRALLLICMVGLALVAWGDDGGRKFATTLEGANETSGGDPNGSGLAKLELNPGQEQVCFQIMVSDIALPATGAHIHEAPAGVAGPIVVPLTPPDASGSSSGCVSADREQILEIIQHPEDYYVNVHSTEFPAGAIRGQLAK